MTTPLDALITALRDAASYNAAAEAPPEAVLWCDENSEFLPLIPSLLDRMPELFVYGTFNAAQRTGPAVWLRAAIVRAVDNIPIAEDATPVIYVPGVGRETLKAADDCPPLLQPLVWLTVAGNLFGHVNGKDWTLRGFLAAERGRLNLNIADDPATRAALSLAAVRFCSRPVDELRARRWDADTLHALLAPDVEADMLDWMDGTFTPDTDRSRFAAFASISGKELKFDPRKLSRQDAAKRLAQRKGRWASIWNRFAGSTGYNGVIQLLHAEEPTDLLADKAPYPKVNASEEKNLREALANLETKSRAEAAAKIASLETAHAWRRDTVWARRGDAPLARALGFLARVSLAKSLPAHDAEALAEAYTADGADIDSAAMSALAAAPREIDRVAVSSALRAIYLPWLDDAANAMQDLIRAGKVELAKPACVDPKVSTFLFVDGLRMDLAKELVQLLLGEGLAVNLSWCWSGFPTVTATCKPLVSPVGSLLSATRITSEMLPVTPEGKPATKAALYNLMNAEGWNTEDALATQHLLWSEVGRFDEEGHALGMRLAERLAAGLRDVADHVIDLARAGRSLRIVTDHGWLLMPGGLPTAPLDPALVEPQGKRTRCALVKPGATPNYLQIPWTWNREIPIVTATGACSFYASQEYAHGGVSPQECILPIIDVAASPHAAHAAIVLARWEGLRLRIEVSGAPDHRIDLRLGTETSGPSLIKGGRVLDESGRTSVLVSDHYERKSACLVVLDDGDHVLAHRTLIVGGD